ncbi:MAG: PAS domain S-box protein [Burkholderiaceae bacterium]|nr:PAS domain S-box protein [Burkholderiaceae bacterium]
MSTQDANVAIGGVLFDIDPERLLFPLLKDWPMPSQTSETLLVSRDGDDVVFLNELRHKKEGLLSRTKIEAGSLLLASQAVSGATGLVRGVDYRGVPVIGVVTSIPDTDWYMISKVDVSEIEQPIQAIAARVSLTIVLLVFTCALLLLFWRRQKHLQYEAAQLHAELQQQALLKHFDYLSKYANDIILLMDDNGVIVEANDRAEAAYGRSRQELVGLHVFELRRSSEIVDFADQWRELKAEKSLLFETYHLHRDGSEFPVEISSRRIETESGAYIQHIIRDITERKNAEARERRLMDIRIALSETNDAILRLEDEATLFPVVCRIAVEFGGMVLAWVGVPDASG